MYWQNNLLKIDSIVPIGWDIGPVGKDLLKAKLISQVYRNLLLV